MTRYDSLFLVWSSAGEVPHVARLDTDRPAEFQYYPTNPIEAIAQAATGRFPLHDSASLESSKETRPLRNLAYDFFK